jgi:predicted nucleotidyltransferase
MLGRDLRRGLMGRRPHRSLPTKLSRKLRYRRVEQLLDPVQMIRAKRDEILRIAAKHGAHNIRVFGSVARGEARAESDVDFLIEAGQVTSSWFPAGLIVDLQDLLGRPVEVVTEKGLNSLIRERVLEEAVPL